MTNPTKSKKNTIPKSTQAYLFIKGAYQSGTLMICRNGKWEQLKPNIYKSNSNAM